MKTSVFGLFVTLVIIFLIYSCEKENNKQMALKGQLISKSSCKSNLKSTIRITETPDSLSCIDYSFDNSINKLTIKHINAGFNCCPDSVYCNVSLNSDTIIINEIEQDGLCSCDCIYDLGIEINGINPKAYQIKLIEPYANDQAKLLFRIDLSKEMTGSFCVTRKEYPWGMQSLNN
jgi:hypothetical protein